MTTLSRKYCEDCRFHAAKTLAGETFHLCHAPQNERPSAMQHVVRDSSETGWFCETARVQRDTDLADYCGTEGRWFVPRSLSQVAA